MEKIPTNDLIDGLQYGERTNYILTNERTSKRLRFT